MWAVSVRWTSDAERRPQECQDKEGQSALVFALRQSSYGVTIASVVLGARALCRRRRRKREREEEAAASKPTWRNDEAELDDLSLDVKVRLPKGTQSA